jgi:hypothetical protein
MIHKKIRKIKRPVAGSPPRPEAAASPASANTAYSFLIFRSSCEFSSMNLKLC